MNYYQTIAKLRDDCKNTYYQNELEGNNKLDEKTTEYLNQQINSKKESSGLNNSNNLNNGIFNDLNNLVYKNHWHKLRPFHQKIKLKEYIETLKIEKKSRKDKLTEKLFSAVDDKFLTKKSEVTYDPFTFSIKKINKLKFDEQKNKYFFE